MWADMLCLLWHKDIHSAMLGFISNLKLKAVNFKNQILYKNEYIR